MILVEKTCLLLGLGFVSLFLPYQRSETYLSGDKYTRVCTFFE